MTDLAAGLYEICPDCEGWCDTCITCMDEGLVPHCCTEDEE
jgi:hypothetical protein